MKEFSVFLVDAGAAMLRPCHALLLPHQREGVSPTDTWLDVAVRVVRETLAAKIIAAPRTDESAVVFYGPRVAKGPASDDEPGVWTFNLGLEGRRNARAAALAGGGQASLAALQASDAPVVGGGGGTKNAGTASARATAVARHAHDSSGIDFPSADLLRALAELVGDGGEGGRGNRARERLFRGNNGNGDNGNNGGGGGGIDEKAQEAKEETVGESVEALLAALRRASTLLSAATKGKRAGAYSQRVVVYSCQPLEFRALFPANPFFSSASAFVPSSSSYSPSAKPPPFDATAATAATFAAAAAAFSQQQQQFFPSGVGGAPTQLQLNQLNHHHRHFLVSPETTAARLKAAGLRSALRERGNALGGSCASLELVALEPFSSSRRSAMAGGVVEAEEEDEEERGGDGEKQRTLASTSSAPAPAPAATASAAADFFGDAGQQRTAWGELLLASAAAARLRAEAASARAMRAAQQVAEEELRQQRLRLQSGRGVAGAEEQSQQQLLLVAALQFKQRQEAEDADRAADFADDAALSLAVTRFSGVSRAARANGWPPP